MLRLRQDGLTLYGVATQTCLLCLSKWISLSIGAGCAVDLSLVLLLVLSNKFVSSNSTPLLMVVRSTCLFSCHVSSESVGKRERQKDSQIVCHLHVAQFHMLGSAGCYSISSMSDCSFCCYISCWQLEFTLLASSRSLFILLLAYYYSYVCVHQQ